jgi:molecular chaperone DnaJ
MASRDWIDKDFYGVLGVGKDASKDEIKRAYRKLAQKYHPDTNRNDKESERQFKEISEAHSVLSNDERRAEYDQLRSVAAGGGIPFGFGTGGPGGTRVDVGDLFGDGGIGDLFGDVFGFSPRRRRGADVEAEAQLSFEEAVSGTTFELPSGTKVRVPPGVKNGARIKVSGKGGPAPPGGQSGDMFVRVHVAPHPLFSSTGGGDLVVEVPVTITEAALGAKVHVPTLDDQVTIKIPAGTRSGRTLRARGKGGPRPGGGRGDLLAKVVVEIPQKLTKKERELLEALAKEHHASPRAHFDRWMDGRRTPSREAS